MYRWQNYGNPWMTPTFGAGPLLIVGALMLITVILWSIIWKGLALWKAARLGSKPWFIALLIVNTLGILEILYLFVFSKKAEAAKESQ